MNTLQIKSILTKVFLHCSCHSSIVEVSEKYLLGIFVQCWFEGLRSQILQGNKLFEDGLLGNSTAITEEHLFKEHILVTVSNF